MIKAKALIYDLDGTIISTVNLHADAWREAGRQYNVELSEDFLRNQKGMTNEAAAKIVLGEDFEQKVADFVKAKEGYVAANTGSAKIFEDFLPAYQKLTEKGIKIWVCTSATKDFTSAVYSAIPLLKPLIDKTITREMYIQGKPEGEPLIVTAELMGEAIENCVYVGDSLNDYLSAKAAGCQFVYFCNDESEKDSRIPADIPTISNHNQILPLILG